MRIGIDVDDTITKTHEYVIKLKKEAFPDWDPMKMLPEEVFLPFIDKNERKIHQNVELKEGAKEALLYMHEKGHKIIILSSRGSYYNKITEDTAYIDTYNYFLKNGLPFDKIVTNLDGKVEACLENKIDLFIDDNIDVCKSVNDANIKVINMKHKNKNNFECNLDTVSNWSEIISKLEEME